MPIEVLNKKKVIVLFNTNCLVDKPQSIVFYFQVLYFYRDSSPLLSVGLKVVLMLELAHIISRKTYILWHKSIAKRNKKNF
jgi:hypothetical protein